MVPLNLWASFRAFLGTVNNIGGKCSSFILKQTHKKGYMMKLCDNKYWKKNYLNCYAEVDFPTHW